MSINTAAGTRIHLKSEPTPPPTPEHKMTQAKLLVITNETHMSETQRTTFTAHVQGIADKVGAELLVLLPGQHAQLLDVRVSLVKATAVEIKEGLRNCSASRGAHLGSQLNSGVIDYGDLKEAITKQHDRLEQILKRVEDTVALLYRWDRAGIPAAHVDCGVGVAAQEVKPLAAVEGVALSYCLDPLESAISLTVQALGDELSRMSDVGATSTTVYQRLGEHLDALLVEQLKRVTADVRLAEVA